MLLRSLNQGIRCEAYWWADTLKTLKIKSKRIRNLILQIYLKELDLVGAASLQFRSLECRMIELK